MKLSELIEQLNAVADIEKLNAKKDGRDPVDPLVSFNCGFLRLQVTDIRIDHAGVTIVSRRCK